MKNIVVTGAGGGIGRACVQELLSNGLNRIYAIDLNPSSLENLRNDFSDDIVNGSLITIQSAISSYEECLQIISSIKDGVSGLVHLAGKNLSDVDEYGNADIWSEVIDSNVRTAYWMAGAALGNRNVNSQIRMVFTSSISYRRGSYDSVVYAMAKSAIVGLTRSMAKRVGNAGLVNAIAPGVIETSMSKSYILQNEERLKQQIPLKRVGQPVDVAKLIGFLVSEECTYITGQTINIDGGLINS